MTAACSVAQVGDREWWCFAHGMDAQDCERCDYCAACERNDPAAPSHDASPRCESGGYPHCTCDTCF